MNRKSTPNRVSSRKRRKKNLDLFIDSNPVIEADFVEVAGNFEETADRNPANPSSSETENGDESIEKLLEYLRNSSPEELTRILEELERILENENCSFESEHENEQETGKEDKTGGTAGKKERIWNISREAFEAMLGATSEEAKWMKDISKTAS